MGIKDRKEREINEKRELILIAANEIIKEEGVEKLSIRKIAKKIEYSPPIVYHYFKNKEDIINQIMTRGYIDILKAISLVEKTTVNPEERLVKTIETYIYKSLEKQQEYKNILLNNSSDILEHTSILYKGASKDRKAINMLCKVLMEIYSDKVSESDSIELMAQSIWASMFGLIIRIIIEGNIDVEQKNRLIKNHIDFILNSILFNKNDRGMI